MSVKGSDVVVVGGGWDADDDADESLFRDVGPELIGLLPGFEVEDADLSLDHDVGIGLYGVEEVIISRDLDGAVEKPLGAEDIGCHSLGI